MSYNKHNWVSNELITHQKLNSMEQGIADAHTQAEKQILDIINNNAELTQAFKNLAMNYTVNISANGDSLIISLVNN